jgi:hypothetical protein
MDLEIRGFMREALTNDVWHGNNSILNWVS